jgi:hypothetical protein
METVYRDFSPRGVQFIYLYKALAHPELHGYVKPMTLKERLMHVSQAERTLGSEIRWLCDTMSNDLKRAIGNAPNSEYLLDPEGIILAKRGWNDPEALRTDLEELLGTVENPTGVADVATNAPKEAHHAQTGVVPRLKLAEQYRALKVTPQLDKSRHPFYVKLRAEADKALQETGKGAMYLGFHLDPLYGVHWNNLVDPVQFEFDVPEGAVVSPSKAEGPKVAEESDSDPREFLILADSGDTEEPMRMSFRYFACTDNMCIPVTQEYLIHWETDPDGGSTIGRVRRPQREGRQQRPAETQQPGS